MVSGKEYLSGTRILVQREERWTAKIRDWRSLGADLYKLKAVGFGRGRGSIHITRTRPEKLKLPIVSTELTHQNKKPDHFGCSSVGACGRLDFLGYYFTPRGGPSERCIGYFMMFFLSIDMRYFVEIMIDPVGVPMCSLKDFSCVGMLQLIQ